MGNALFATILSVSIAIQIAAAVYALLNVLHTPKRVAWLLVAAAIVLMAVRRIITLSGMIATWETPRAVSWGAELTALLISILMASGMILINRMVKGVNREMMRQRALFRESLHTSKNNLMSLTSMLRVQADYAEDSVTRAFTLELVQKVAAYSLLQQQLFENQAQPEAVPYLNELIATIEEAYTDSSRFHPVERTIEPFDSSPQDLLYAGLVVTEALINSFKYATNQTHPTDRVALRVAVRMSADGKHHISICDSGVGYPEEVLNGSRTGFGLSFLRNLNKGAWSVTYGNDRGACVEATF